MSIIKQQKEEKPQPKRPVKILVTEAQLKMIIDKTKNNITQILESNGKYI